MTTARVRRPARVTLLAAVGAAALLLVGAPSRASGVSTTVGTKQLTLYSVATQKEFVNNADDRSRGQGKNPFGNYSGSTVTPPANEKLFGPFAGDEGEFAYKLYSDSSKKKSAGTAIVVCQYNLNKDAFCDAAFQLSGGTLIAKGPLNFNATRFTAAILGGTDAYKGMIGTIDVSTLGVSTQAQPVFRAVPALEEQRLTVGIVPGGKSPGGPQALDEFTLPQHEIFINNNDDEARGDVNNVFGLHNTRAAATKENGDGPFPGDSAFFSFSVYTTSALNGKPGSALYMCQYYFNKNAFCDAQFQVSGGTLAAAGTLNFNGTTFELAVTGGTGKYLGATGDVHASASGKQAQKIAFKLD
jgi:hypothetical protein